MSPKKAAARPDGRGALARLLTLLDNGDPAGLDRLTEMPEVGLPYIVGITGAAGVGKSLLLAKLAAVWPAQKSRPAGIRIGILAVDPSHPETGGALLGDRIRMPVFPPHVFFRSVATRGGTGGLSEKMIDMAAAMRGYGCETVFVETVGIGQDEWLVRQVADTLIVIEAPGLGDDIQAMKASPISVADVLVVNKADKPGAAETAAILQDVVGKKPVLTSAIEGKGVSELAGALEDCRGAALQPDAKKAADRNKWTCRLTQGLLRKWSDRVSTVARDIAAGGTASAPDIYRRFRDVTAFLPDHAAVAVSDLEKSIEDYRRIGFLLERRETFPAEGVETAFLNAAGFHIELLRPLTPDSPVAKFIAERGGGLHHLAFEVDDLPGAARALKDAGVETIGGIRSGARGKQILFLHPKAASRVLLEFCSCAMHTRSTC